MLYTEDASYQVWWDFINIEIFIFSLVSIIPESKQIKWHEVQFAMDLPMLATYELQRVREHTYSFFLKYLLKTDKYIYFGAVWI